MYCANVIVNLFATVNIYVILVCTFVNFNKSQITYELALSQSI